MIPVQVIFDGDEWIARSRSPWPPRREVVRVLAGYEGVDYLDPDADPEALRLAGLAAIRAALSYVIEDEELVATVESPWCEVCEETLGVGCDTCGMVLCASCSEVPEHEEVHHGTL